MRQALPRIAALEDVRARLTTPRHPILPRVALTWPPTLTWRERTNHPTMRPRSRGWAGSKAWLLPGGLYMQSFAEIDECHLVATMHRTAADALPVLRHACIDGDDTTDPFALIFAGAELPWIAPSEAALATMLASLRQAEGPPQSGKACSPVFHTRVCPSHLYFIW